MRCEYPNCSRESTQTYGTDFTPVCRLHRAWHPDPTRDVLEAADFALSQGVMQTDLIHRLTAHLAQRGDVVRLRSTNMQATLTHHVRVDAAATKVLEASGYRAWYDALGTEWWAPEQEWPGADGNVGQYKWEALQDIAEDLHG